MYCIFSRVLLVCRRLPVCLELPTYSIHRYSSRGYTFSYVSYVFLVFPRFPLFSPEVPLLMRVTGRKPNSYPIRSPIFDSMCDGIVADKCHNYREVQLARIKDKGDHIAKWVTYCNGDTYPVSAIVRILFRIRRAGIYSNSCTSG
jgi:hypothetical protein